MSNDVISTERNVSLFDTLNPKQREAVEDPHGQILVLAGAGTGKTKVLTARLLHLLTTQQATPSQILAVTFTNKAAQEIRTRVSGMIDFPVERLWIGTFHALCARMLRPHAEICGLKSNFVILDKADQRHLIKQMIKEKPLLQNTPEQIVSLFDQWKSRDWRPARLISENNPLQELYVAYQERLLAMNACDFNDLIVHTVFLLRDTPEALTTYHERFHYLLVDEYQDINALQYLWLRLLSQGHQNIFCVGDEDQSIYGWRGTQIEHILNFEKDFPGAKIVRLEQSYRSTGHILAAASGMISHNRKRLGKTLWADVQPGDKVQIICHLNNEDEAQWIGQEIHRLKSSGIPFDHMTILVRAGSQTRDFEDYFFKERLPYRIIGGLRFYERLEIKDIVAYLRVVAQSEDNIAFERVLNVHPRIGKQTIQKALQNAQKEEVSLDRAVRILCLENALRADSCKTLTDFTSLIDRWRGLRDTFSPLDLTRLILDESGYKKRLLEEDNPQAKLENIDEMLNLLSGFNTLQDFLEYIALRTENTEEVAGEEVVRIMTLHKAKGLEFDVVFLPGWVEGLFPHSRVLKESGQEDLEEERRLAYVGLTRARKKAYICFTCWRHVFGELSSTMPSRFIDELPRENVEVQKAFRPSTNSVHSSEKLLRWNTENKRSKNAKKSVTKIRPSSRTSKITRGNRVFHKQFGHGTVLKVDQDKLEILFDEFGYKNVLDKFVETTF